MLCIQHGPQMALPTLELKNIGNSAKEKEVMCMDIKYQLYLGKMSQWWFLTCNISIILLI